MMKPRRVLVAFVDALGPLQLESLSAELGFVPHRGTLRGVLGYSSGAIATVLTGAAPREHGRMCLFSRTTQERSPLAPLAWLGLLPRLLHERGRVRRAVARLFARATENTGYVALHRVPPAAFDWLDLPEKEDLVAARDIGGATTFLARAREAGLSVQTARWQLPEAERFTALESDVMKSPADLTFAYAAGLDGALHAEGNGSPRARDAAKAIGSHLQRVRDRLARDGEVTTIVVGDHGMADIHLVVDPRSVVSRIDAHAKLFVDSTLLRVWSAPQGLARARAEIERAGWPGKWLDREALDQRDASTQGSPYGDAIFVLDEGALFAPSWVGGSARGMHGYDAGTASSAAAVASDHALPSSLVSLMDVRGAVESALGLGLSS